jgi:hypothetical protein
MYNVKEKSKVCFTNPIPIPNTNRPITITAKAGARAVTSAPTRYKKAARINSLLLPSS